MVLHYDEDGGFCPGTGETIHEAELMTVSVQFLARTIGRGLHLCATSRERHLARLALEDVVAKVALEEKFFG